MGHADHDLAHGLVRGPLHHGIERRDQRLGAFQREALLTQEAGVQEALEELGGGELLQDAQTLGRREHAFAPVALELLLDPLLATRILDVGELDADVATVGVPQALHDLVEGLDRAAGKIIEQKQREALVQEPSLVVRRGGEGVSTRIRRIARAWWTARSVAFPSPTDSVGAVADPAVSAAAAASAAASLRSKCSAQLSWTELGSTSQRWRISATSSALTPNVSKRAGDACGERTRRAIGDRAPDRTRPGGPAGRV